MAGSFFTFDSFTRSQENQRKLEPPVVRFQGLSKAGVPIFEVTNPNAAPLPFVGYIMNVDNSGVKDGKISPLFAIELRRGDEWKNAVIGWCGTGTGPVTIPAGAKVTFEAFPQPGDWAEMKAGLRWYPSSDRKGGPATAWSDRVLRQQVEKQAP